MALKFLNKKGWHTGSLRNVENVWKAEQKRDAEDRKLEELRKQIHEERQKHEFRLLQEQAGLTTGPERLDFLYESGLAVGKSSSEAYQPLPPPPASTALSAEGNASSSKSATPGALFEDKPHSANDAWRKLHSDPLLMIKQREQEALARIKNNPIKMAMIKKSMDTKKKQHKDKKDKREKKSGKKHRSDKLKSTERDAPSVDDSDSVDWRKHEDRKRSERTNERNKPADNDRHRREHSDSSEDFTRRKRARQDDLRYRSGEQTRHDRLDSEHRHSRSDRASEGGDEKLSHVSHRRGGVRHMTEEERLARLQQMQQDAEIHEEQRWTRVKKAADADAKEASAVNKSLGGKNFLEDEQKKVYGTERGGSSTIEESVRRRAYYSQGGDAHEHNAFRR